MTRLTKLAGERRHLAEASLRLATIDFVAGRRDAGLAHLEALLKQQPRMAKALALRGRFRLEMGQTEAAIADLQQAITTDNKYDAGHFWLAQAFIQRRQAADARAALATTLRLNPGYVPAQVELSGVQLAAKEYEQAIVTAQEAVSKAPDFVEARLALTRAFLGGGRLDDATAALAPVAAALPKDRRVVLLDGEIRLARRDPRGAEQRFAAALAAEPASAAALSGLVASRIAAGNVASALAAVNAAVEKAPSDAGALVVAARAYGETRDFVRAEALLKRAIDADPAMLEAYSMLGQLYVATNRLDDALREFTRLASLQPKAVGPRTVVAVLHHMANRRDDAKTAYEAVLQVDAGAVVAANNLAWMKVEDGENLDVALQLAQAAKVKAPHLPEISDTLGLIYYKRNLFAFSAAAYADAVKYAPGNPEYHYRLGLALARNNEPDRARQAFTRALSLSSTFPGAADAKAQLAALPPARS